MPHAGFFQWLCTGLRRWRRRARMRRELIALDARGRRDLNLRWEDTVYEAGKPAWRE